MYKDEKKDFENSIDEFSIEELENIIDALEEEIDIVRERILFIEEQEDKGEDWHDVDDIIILK